MPILPIKIPPGVYKNGTEYQSKGRWSDADLVRWYEGAMRPIGGWRQHTTTTFSDKARAMLAWGDNSGDRKMAIGTASNLYVMGEDNTMYNITPTGLATGSVDAFKATGYGSQMYGKHNYGTTRPDTATYQPATTWALDNWGENLVACSTSDGKIYEWSLVFATAAAVVANAPINNQAIVVTSERFLFALGAGGNNRKIQWSDQEDNTTWTPSATNQAGDIDLITDGAIQCGTRVRGQTLILTSTDAHAATYQGAPYVYGFEKVGSACGVIGPKAVVSADNFAVWMGKKSFFYYDGYVKALESDVADFIFNDLNEDQRSKVYGVLNNQFSEAWWFYPSDGSIECDSYVSWNWLENHWNVGKLDRTAGVDRTIFRSPLFAGTDSYIHEHETGFTYDSRTPYAESGPLEISNGENVMNVTGMIPDENTLGDVEAKFKTRFHPTDTEREYGPFTMTNPTSVRFTGRQVKMRVQSVRNTDWRVGEMRLEGKVGGRR
jgi:hypothetical protein